MSIPEQDRDDVLLWRAAKGDDESFTLLYRRHQAALYRFALRMTGNAWAAEEVVQDVFMTLMREPKKYDAGRGAVGAYLFGIARNRVMKHLERLPRELSMEARNGNGVRAGDTGCQCVYAGALGRAAGTQRARARRGTGAARGISRSGGAVRAGRTQLRGSSASQRLPHRYDPLAAASRAGRC